MAYLDRPVVHWGSIGVICIKQLNDSSKEWETNLRRKDQFRKLICTRQLRQMDDDANALRRTHDVRVLQFRLERIVVEVAEESPGADFDTVMNQQVIFITFCDLNERLSTLDVFFHSVIHSNRGRRSR